MDVPFVNLFGILLLLVIDYSSIISAYDFQCLTCDNTLDGPGCGEFTRQIPVRTCQTFCYFAVLNNRSSSSTPVRPSESPSRTHLRAIRDCSPYDDMSVEAHVLLESKIGASHPLDILTIKRCNSEQCNNDFYLNTDVFLSHGNGRLRPPASFVSLVIIFYYFKSMF